MNRIGIIEAPGLIEPLRRAGFSVVTGGEWRKAAMAVRDARKESGPFPVLVADVSRPAIQAWVDAMLSRSDCRVVALRDPAVERPAGLDSASELFQAVDLPADVSGILEAAGVTATVSGRLESLDRWAEDADAGLPDDLFDLDVPAPEPAPEADDDDFTPLTLPGSVLPSSGPPADLFGDPEPGPEPQPQSESVAMPEIPQPEPPTAEPAGDIMADLFGDPEPQPQSESVAMPEIPQPEPPTAEPAGDIMADLFGDPEPQPQSESVAMPEIPQPEPPTAEPAARPRRPLLADMTDDEITSTPTPAPELLIPAVPLLVDGKPAQLPKTDAELAAEDAAREAAEEDQYDEPTVVAPHPGTITPKENLPHYRESDTPVVFTMAAKGGVTKTTTALAIAHRAATEYHKRVTLIDMNRGQGSICLMLRMDTERMYTDEGLPTVYDMAVTRRPETAIILPERASHFRPPQLPPIPFALMLAPTDLLNDPLMVDDQIYRVAIEYAQTVSDLVVVDTQIIESTDVSGLVDNVMSPFVRERGAWAVGLFENNRESIDNLVSRLQTDFDGAPTGRVLLELALSRPDEMGQGLLEGLDRRFVGLGQFIGANLYDSAFRDQLNTGVIDSSSPAVVEVTDKVVSRVLGVEPHAVSAAGDTGGGGRRRGLFRRRR